MNKQDAINVLIQIAGMAQKAGILTLKDAAIVAEAVDVLAVAEKKTVEAPEKPKKKD